MGSILPPAAEGSTGDGLRMVLVEQVRPNPHQPRKTFDPEALAGLVESVREMGVLQPVLVRPEGDGYVLIAGERRFRAAQRAGLLEIPAVVRSVDDLGSLEQALVENLHRQDLNPLEEAAAYQQLIEDFGLTQEQVAKRVGKTRPTVANHLRLFQLSPTAQKLLGDGDLTFGHAKALLGHPDRAYQDALARKVVSEGLSVREVEARVKERLDLEAGRDPDAAAGRRRRPAKGRPAGVVEMENLLADRLDTKVEMTVGARRGRVTIEFADFDDLERIARIIIGS
ncbi:MAG: ParB/RepB/Spo0J family partition protein [Actinomycetes bacterium]